MKELLPVIDAVNLDVKSFTDDFYKIQCGAALGPVLENAETIYKSGVHIELTMLIIPGLNDNMQSVHDFALWVKDIDADIPVHFSAYHPAYKEDSDPTPVATVLEARRIALGYLHYVYGGNINDLKSGITYCGKCGKAVVTRSFMHTKEINLNKGRCIFCGNSIPGVFSD